MSISHTLLSEFEQEMANTRKTLERVPEDKYGWKPHPKSGSFGWLATHLARIPSWAAITLSTEALDLAEPGPQQKEAGSRAELLDIFDKNVAEARAALSSAGDDQFMGLWALKSGGKDYFKMPRIAVLRMFVMNHNVHHRAQLGLYLRLNEVPVPAIYGPSADEGGM